MTTPALPLAQLTDYSTFTAEDGALVFDLTGRVIRGADVVIEQVARAWVTEKLPWDPNAGEDIGLAENTQPSARDLAWWKMRLGTVAQRIDYVQACAVTVAHDGAAKTFTARGNVTLIDGKSYPLAVQLSQASGAVRVFLQRAA